MIDLINTAPKDAEPPMSKVWLEGYMSCAKDVGELSLSKYKEFREKLEKL